MELGYTQKTTKGFDEVVAKIEELTASKQFRVLHVHNVQQTLKDKGLDREPYKIIEICNAKFAHGALNVSPEVGLFMPCKINVYTKDGETIITAMNPKMISEFFDDPKLKDLADEVDKIMRSIVDEAK
jgi:uncharacterized protein (DUF302 family)